MKLQTFLYLSLLLVAALLFTCFGCARLASKSVAASQKTNRKLQTQLEAAQPVAKAKPFQPRKFKAYYQGKWIGQAVSYGCYRKGQAPWGLGPSKQQIAEDLTILSQYWNLIRVYNADADTERILEVIKAEKFPIKMMLGVWLENETDKPEKRENNIKNVLKCLELVEKYPEIIIAVNVGNETQVGWSAHKMQQANLVRYIRAVRKNTKLPVTTADDYSFWNKPKSRELADEVDFIVFHMHPVWNGKKLAETEQWLDKTCQEVELVHPQKQVIIGETGWATRYNSQKKGAGEQGTLIKGEISLAAQEKFLIMLDNWINKNQVTTFLFEAFDEPWKGGGENTPANEIEKNWGVFYENRIPKPSFSNYVLHKKESSQQIP